MQTSTSQLQRSLACLAHASRFQILLRLLARPWFVSELARDVRLSQSCTTRHLQAMARVGLVRGVRSGRRVFFEAERQAPVLAAFEACLGEESSAPLPKAAPAGRRDPARGTATAPATARRAEATRHGGGAPAPTPDPDSESVAGAGPRSAPTDLEDFLL